MDYGVYHEATLTVDVEDGRFVFFYLPVDLERAFLTGRPTAVTHRAPKRGGMR